MYFCAQKISMVAAAVVMSQSKHALTLGYVTTLILIVALALQLYYNPFAAERHEEGPEEKTPLSTTDSKDSVASTPRTADAKPDSGTSNKVASKALQGQVIVGISGLAAKHEIFPSSAEWFLGGIILIGALGPVCYTIYILVGRRRRYNRVDVRP